MPPLHLLFDIFQQGVRPERRASRLKKVQAVLAVSNDAFLGQQQGRLPRVIQDGYAHRPHRGNDGPVEAFPRRRRVEPRRRHALGGLLPNDVHERGVHVPVGGVEVSGVRLSPEHRGSQRPGLVERVPRLLEVVLIEARKGDVGANSIAAMECTPTLNVHSSRKNRRKRTKIP